MKRRLLLPGTILALGLLASAAPAGAADGPIRLLKDVSPIPDGTDDSAPRFLGTATTPDGRETAVFSAWSGNTKALWASDGTAGGTVFLAHAADQDYTVSAAFHGSLYFGASGGGRGFVPWRSDGTPGGTSVLLDRIPPPWGHLLLGPYVLQDRLVFTSQSATDATELWSSDGTLEVTPARVWDYRGNFVLFRAIVAGERLYFHAYGDLDDGEELYVSDGTAAGPRLIRDFMPGTDRGCCIGWFDMQGRLLVAVNDGVHGYEPWVTDGTDEGTFLLKDIDPGPGTSVITDIRQGGPYVYFPANDAAHGRELWRTDGTEEGTILVKDIRPGDASSSPRILGEAGGFLLFTALDSSGSSSDLWRTNGTEAGTILVKQGCNARAAGGFDGVLLFSDADGEHGYELWRTDGTAAGTVFVQDLVPGPDGSYPAHFIRTGTYLLLRSDDPAAGLDLYSGRMAIVLGRPLQALLDLEQEVTGSAMPGGIAAALKTRLDSAAKALEAGRRNEALMHLGTFLRLVDRLSRPIGEETSEALTTFAEDLLRLLQNDGSSAPAPKVLRQVPEP